MTSNLEESLRLDALTSEKEYWYGKAKAAQYEHLYWKQKYDNLKMNGAD